MSTENINKTEEWLMLEFEQNFEQLRDRDDKMLDLFKYYSTGIAAVGATCLTVFEGGKLSNPTLTVGLFLLLISILAELFFFWLATFRTYFVTCARQLNAIRKYYSEPINAANPNLIIQSKSHLYPKLYTAKSAHTIMLVAMTTINCCMAGIAQHLIFVGYFNLPKCYAIAGWLAVLLIVTLTNYIYAKSLGK